MASVCSFFSFFFFFCVCVCVCLCVVYVSLPILQYGRGDLHRAKDQGFTMDAVVWLFVFTCNAQCLPNKWNPVFCFSGAQFNDPRWGESPPVGRECVANESLAVPRWSSQSASLNSGRRERIQPWSWRLDSSPWRARRLLRRFRTS